MLEREGGLLILTLSCLHNVREGGWTSYSDLTMLEREGGLPILTLSCLLNVREGGWTSHFDLVLSSQC